MKPGERFIKDQLQFLAEQLQCHCIDVPQFMKLISMVYSDWMEFFPEEKPEYYDKRKFREQMSDLEREHGISN